MTKECPMTKSECRAGTLFLAFELRHSLVIGHWELVIAMRPRVGSHWREGLTPFLNLPAPGRRQSLYLRLRIRRDLCF